MTQEKFIKRIDEFPATYSWFKRSLATILFNLGGIIIYPRKNLLNIEDLNKARSILKKGDILLAGNLKTAFSKVLANPVTHSALYIKKNKIIHSIHKGVITSNLSEFFSTYDTLIILRIPSKKYSSNVKNHLINDVIKFAKNQLGKPYNFYFSKDEESYFCSALVNDSFNYSGYETGIKTHDGISNFINEIDKLDTKKINLILKKLKERKFKDITKILKEIKNKRIKEITPLLKKLKERKFREIVRPASFVKGNFEIVFTSHNIKIKNKKIIFTENKSRIIKMFKELKIKYKPKLFDKILHHHKT